MRRAILLMVLSAGFALAQPVPGRGSYVSGAPNLTGSGYLTQDSAAGVLGLSRLHCALGVCTLQAAVGSPSTLIVQATAAQGATDLVQVKNAAGTVIANINAGGELSSQILLSTRILESASPTVGIQNNWFESGSSRGIRWAAVSNINGATFDLSLLRKTSSPGVARFGDGATGLGSVEANNLTAVALATPATPVITQGGTGGAETYGYKVACLAGDATTTAASVEGTTATGNATLDGTNYNIVTFTPSTGRTTCDVFRTVGGATQGKIGNTTASVFNDTGLAASGAAPSANTTGTVTVGGNLLWTTDNSSDIGASGANRPRYLYTSSRIFGGGDMSLPASGSYFWLGRSMLQSAANGYITFLDNANTDFQCTRYGGVTNAFGAVCRDGAGIKIRAASNDADAPLSALSFAQKGANGQAATIQQSTELLTINAAATTDTALQIPANAIVLGVSVRVTTVIPTATTFTVIGATSSTAFQTGASVSTAATTTDPGTKSCPYLNTAAQNIRITPSDTPADNTGRVRVTVHYIEITPPTS